MARLVQLGVRQSRYFGRAKTRFQLLLAATVANLTLVATKTGMRVPDSRLLPGLTGPARRRVAHRYGRIHIGRSQLGRP